MAKVAVLVPNQELCSIAQPLIDEFPSLSLMTIEYIKTEQVSLRARELERQGCDLIVARGVHAHIIKRDVKLPLVEIRVTQQELASVMLDLKEELGLPCPKIALIGFSNMFSNTDHFNRLFDIDLRLYMVKQNDELDDAVEHAFADGCNAVIGGDIVCKSAQKEKLPYRFIPSGQESLRNALGTATRVAYAIDMEKKKQCRNQRTPELYFQWHYTSRFIWHRPSDQSNQQRPFRVPHSSRTGQTNFGDSAQSEP